jgi:hypothetical protein
MTAMVAIDYQDQLQPGIFDYAIRPLTAFRA